MSPPWPVPADALGPIAIGTKVWRMAGVARVTVLVKATFGFVHGGAARLLPPRELVREDRGHDGILDEAAETAPFLPGAGVVLTGHAYAPGGRPAPSVAVRLGVYRERALLDKTLHVFGPRAAGTGAPQPFRKMPIGWDRARGGAGCDDNPVGVAAQPNVVDPLAAQRPAGFGPIPPHWGPRRRRLGAAEAMQGGETSEIPEGIDFRCFHAAPEDQQIAYLQGDEWIVLDGLHPALARTQTRLPGARAEARWHTPRGIGHPVELCADTLEIDADLRVCSVIWRGCFALEEAPAHLRVEAGLALPAKPVAWPEITPATPMRPPEPLARSVSPDAPMPLTEPLVLPAPDRAALPFRKITLVGSEPHEPTGGAPARLDGALPFRPVTMGDPPPLPQEPPITPPEEMAEVPEDVTRRVDANKIHALLAPFAVAEPGSRSATPALPLPGAPWSEPASAAPAEVATSDESGAQAPPSTPPPAAPAEPPSPPEPPAVIDGEADKARSRVRDEVIAALAAREALREIDLQGADLHGIDFSRAALGGCKLAGADLRGCVMVEARLGDADLAGADLTDAVLDAADLVRADLSRATLTGASLAGALLTDADFASARGEGASFAGASGARPRFARGTWDGASFERLDVTAADFSAASLAGARFAGASLIELRLDDAAGEGASFDGARMPGAHAESSAFQRASFKGAEAPGSTWDRATLDEAVFTDADLEGADFARAACPRAIFAGARAARANLARLGGEGADLRRAVLTGADLRGARLAEASCEEADLRNVQAQKIDLSRARLTGANLSGANLRSGKLTGAVLAGAVLDAADLRDADLERADVTGASRRSTKLNGANLKDLVGGDG